MSSSSELARQESKARIKELIDRASDIQFRLDTPLRRYLHSAKQMLQIARELEQSSEEMALRHYTRYVTLIVEKIPQHPEFQKFCKTDKDKLLKLRESTKEAFAAAERLKAKVQAVYERQWQELQAEKEKETARLAEEEAKADATSDGPVPSPPLQVTAISGPMDSSDESGGFAVSSPFMILENRLEDQKPPDVDAGRHLPPVPTIDRSTKPKMVTTTNSSFSCLSPSQYPDLSPVTIPGNLIHRFMRCADSNTRNDVETCGILCGKLVNGTFEVTHLIVPKQTGTSTSCSADDEEFYALQIEQNLLQLGWIHTHPTQTAFLSSVDLHMHCSYQLMFPEAVAVVCSPKHNQIGVFMLTPDRGMKEVSECHQTGFHPHTQDPPLFQRCPHARVIDGADGCLMDLRA